MNLDLLAIAAIPTTLNSPAAALSSKWAQAGYETGILDLTAGEMGTLGTPETGRKKPRSLPRSSK